MRNFYKIEYFTVKSNVEFFTFQALNYNFLCLYYPPNRILFPRKSVYNKCAKRGH